MNSLGLEEGLWGLGWGGKLPVPIYDSTRGLESRRRCVPAAGGRRLPARPEANPAGKRETGSERNRNGHAVTQPNLWAPATWPPLHPALRPLLSGLRRVAGRPLSARGAKKRGRELSLCLPGWSRELSRSEYFSLTRYFGATGRSPFAPPSSFVLFKYLPAGCCSPRVLAGCRRALLWFSAILSHLCVAAAKRAGDVCRCHQMSAVVAAARGEAAMRQPQHPFFRCVSALGRILASCVPSSSLGTSAAGAASPQICLWGQDQELNARREPCAASPVSGVCGPVPGLAGAGAQHFLGGSTAFWGSTAVLAGQGMSSTEQKSLPALGCCSGFVLIERLFSRRRAFLLTSVQM